GFVKQVAFDHANRDPHLLVALVLGDEVAKNLGRQCRIVIADRNGHRPPEVLLGQAQRSPVRGPDGQGILYHLELRMGPSQQPAQLRDLMPLESRALGQKGRACARKLLPELGNRLCFLFLAPSVLSTCSAASSFLTAPVPPAPPGPVSDARVAPLRPRA